MWQKCAILFVVYTQLNGQQLKWVFKGRLGEQPPIFDLSLGVWTVPHLACG